MTESLTPRCGLSEKQIAAVTGLSQAAVRSQVALAFSVLGAELPSVT